MQTTTCGVCLVVLAAVVQSWDTSTTAASTTRHTPHAVVYIVCFPDDGHNDARNMLS